MRKLLSFVLVFLSIQVFAQPKANQETANFNIYVESLRCHLRYLDSLNKKIGIETASEVKVENNFDVENFPHTVEGVNVTLLTRSEIKSIVKKKKKGIELIVFQPIEIGKDYFKISISDYHVTFKQNLNYGLGGGSTLIFKYDCHSDSFILLDKKHGGI